MRATWHVYRFMSAAGVSLLLHIALAVALAAAPPVRPPERASAEIAVVWDEASIEAALPPPPPPLTEPPEATEPPPPPPPRLPLQLGLEESEAMDAKAWLGFLDPTEHQAPESTTEQPALVVNPPAAPSPEAEEPPQPDTAPPAAPSVSTPPAPTTPPRATPEETPPAATPVRDAVAPAPTPQAPKAEGAPDGKTDIPPAKELTPTGVRDGSPTAPLPATKPPEPPPPPNDDPGTPPEPPAPEGDPDSPDNAARDAALGDPDGAAERPPPDSEAAPELLGPPVDFRAPEPSDQPVTPPASPPTPPAKTSPSTPTAETEPGIVGDRESGATALTKPLEIRPGRTLAIKGQIEIKTRRPVFSTLTRLSAVPTSVSIRVEFNAAGTVVRHQWINPSGRPDIDNPVADAVYLFRASGPAIRALAEPLPAGTAPPAPVRPAAAPAGAPVLPGGATPPTPPPERTLSLTFNIILS